MSITTNDFRLPVVVVAVTSLFLLIATIIDEALGTISGYMVGGSIAGFAFALAGLTYDHSRLFAIHRHQLHAAVHFVVGVLLFVLGAAASNGSMFRLWLPSSVDYGVAAVGGIIFGGMMGTFGPLIDGIYLSRPIIKVVLLIIAVPIFAMFFAFYLPSDAILGIFFSLISRVFFGVTVNAAWLRNRATLRPILISCILLCIVMFPLAAAVVG